MNNVLLIFDGINASRGAFEFARRLNEIEPVLLTGAFLPQTDFSAAWSYSTGEGPLPIPTVEPSVSEKVAENILQFEDLCRKNDIAFKTHRNFLQLAIPELLKETRFADVMILGSEKFFSGDAVYLSDVLHNTECPVLVVPEQCRFPEQLVLAYDGSAAAVRAIKKFACLFPALCLLPATLLYISTSRDEEESLPEEDYIEELAARHFSNLDLRHLELKTGNEFAPWISGLTSPLLVSGSFSRSFLSQTFRESFAQKIIDGHFIPLFIAHK